MQVVQLDKHIRLLDSPGVVIATKMTDSAAAVLRNCVRVSNASLGPSENVAVFTVLLW